MIADENLRCLNGNFHKTFLKKEKCTICKKTNITDTNYTKVNCSRCNKVIKSTAVKYHNCDINFNKYEEDAWEGDALHRLDSIKLLKSLGKTKDSSNTLLTNLVSAESQVRYLLKIKQIDEKDTFKYSDHKLSCIFEAKYLKSHYFREFYRCYATKIISNYKQ
jgi:hypothetical protein